MKSFELWGHGGEFQSVMRIQENGWIRKSRNMSIHQSSAIPQWLPSPGVVSVNCTVHGNCTSRKMQSHPCCFCPMLQLVKMYWFSFTVCVLSLYLRFMVTKYVVELCVVLNCVRLKKPWRQSLHSPNTSVRSRLCWNLTTTLSPWSSTKVNYCSANQLFIWLWQCTSTFCIVYAYKSKNAVFHSFLICFLPIPGNINIF